MSQSAIRGTGIYETTHDLLFLSLVRQAVASKSTARLLEAVEVLLNPLDILEAKFGLDNLHIADRVDVALDVNDLGVIESAHHLEDTIYGTDMREESVAQTGTSGRSLGSVSWRADGSQSERTAVRPAISRQVK